MPARTLGSTMPCARLPAAWRLPRWDPAWGRDLSTFKLALIRLSCSVHHTLMWRLPVARQVSGHGSGVHHAIAGRPSLGWQVSG